MTRPLLAPIAGLLVLPTLAAPALAAPPAAATWMKPGQWDIAVTIDNVQMQGSGGMPGLAAMLKGRTTHSLHCLTAAEAANGAQEMLAAQKDCTHGKHVIAKGHISSELTCHRGKTISQVATDGDDTPVSFTLKSRAVESGGSMPMIMDSTSVGKRTGECG